MAYSNARDQANQTGTALMKRLTTNHFALTEGVSEVLVAQGLPADTLPMLASTCLAVNIPPNIMRYTHNVPQVIRVLKLVTELGYRAGEDFHISIFDSNVPLLDEEGNPTKDKAKAPTVVVMPSAARAEENAKQDDRLTKLMHHVEAFIVNDETEARTAFDEAFKGTKAYRDVVVAKAELYTYHSRTGQAIGSGRPQVFYGFYTPYYIYQGKESADYNEMGKPKDNYSPADVAMKRARVKAFRAVTRTNYARDDRPADVRLAAMMEAANNRLATAERIADNFGVTIESAITDGEEIAEQHQGDDKDTAPVNRKGDPLAALMMFEGEADEDTVDGEFSEAPEDDPEEREAVTLVKVAIAAWKRNGKQAEAHIDSVLKKHKVDGINELSDEVLADWLSFIAGQADTEPA